MDFREVSDRMKVAMFDMDGTLIDSMRQWRQCNVEHLAALGCRPTPSQMPHILQASSSAMLFDYVKAAFGVDIDKAAFIALQKRRMYDVYREGVGPKPGVVAYLRRLRARGVKTVVTTATWATHTALALSQSGLLPYFDGLYACDVVGLPKSDPAYFDKVAELAGRPKGECVLFEDALYAIESGRRAGLLGTVALTDPTNTLFRDDMRRLADALVDSMAELP